MSPSRLREHRNALVDFHNVYVEFLEEVLHKNAPVDPQKAMQLRAEVIARLPQAERALGIAGVNMAYLPPPLTGGPVMRGLVNTVFLHEEPGYRLQGWAGQKPTYAGVIDMLRLGAQHLEDQEADERRRRRNPLYWVELGVGLTLGIPAYIVSRLLGVPSETVEGSPFRLPLRLVGALADFAGVFALVRMLVLH
jgi:hypothetical protein